jgi:phosphatidylglycerophosphate synthase
MTMEHPLSETWHTKPTDRFVLKWIKLNLSARVTPRLTRFPWLRPWMITVCSMALGISAGIVFALGWGFPAGLIAAVSQVLDGVDGQFARLTGRNSSAGAFLDSVLDRYADGALVIGLSLYTITADVHLPIWVLGTLGASALIGSGLISYTSARAESLGIRLGKPTLASKGTRTTIIALSGLLSPLSSMIPPAALCYLAAHTNAVAVYRIVRVCRHGS